MKTSVFSNVQILNKLKQALSFSFCCGLVKIIICIAFLNDAEENIYKIFILGSVWSYSFTNVQMKITLQYMRKCYEKNLQKPKECHVNHF